MIFGSIFCNFVCRLNGVIVVLHGSIIDVTGVPVESAPSFQMESAAAPNSDSPGPESKQSESPERSSATIGSVRNSVPDLATVVSGETPVPGLVSVASFVPMDSYVSSYVPASVEPHSTGKSSSTRQNLHTASQNLDTASENLHTAFERQLDTASQNLDTASSHRSLDTASSHRSLESTASENQNPNPKTSLCDSDPIPEGRSLFGLSFSATSECRKLSPQDCASHYVAVDGRIRPCVLNGNLSGTFCDRDDERMCLIDTVRELIVRDNQSWTNTNDIAERAQVQTGALIYNNAAAAVVNNNSDVTTATDNASDADRTTTQTQTDDPNNNADTTTTQGEMDLKTFLDCSDRMFVFDPCLDVYPQDSSSSDPSSDKASSDNASSDKGDSDLGMLHLHPENFDSVSFWNVASGVYRDSNSNRYSASGVYRDSDNPKRNSNDDPNRDSNPNRNSVRKLNAASSDPRPFYIAERKTIIAGVSKRQVFGTCVYDKNQKKILLKPISEICDLPPWYYNFSIGIGISKLSIMLGNLSMMLGSLFDLSSPVFIFCVLFLAIFIAIMNMYCAAKRQMRRLREEELAQYLEWRGNSITDRNSGQQQLRLHGVMNPTIIDSYSPPVVRMRPNLPQIGPGIEQRLVTLAQSQSSESCINGNSNYAKTTVGSSAAAAA